MHAMFSKEFFDKETVEILISVMILSGLLAVVLFLVHRMFRPLPVNHSLDGTIKHILYLAGHQKAKHTWGFFSSDLQEQLTKICEETLNETQVPISHYLDRFFKQHRYAFIQGKPIIFSRHKVSQAQSDLDLVMVHVKSHHSARKLTIWLSRTLSTQSAWKLEDLFIHPPPNPVNTTIKTSTNCLSGRKLTVEQKKEIVNTSRSKSTSKKLKEKLPEKETNSMAYSV
jgi:hypothetical protein